MLLLISSEEESKPGFRNVLLL